MRENVGREARVGQWAGVMGSLLYMMCLKCSGRDSEDGVGNAESEGWKKSRMRARTYTDTDFTHTYTHTLSFFPCKLDGSGGRGTA